jgi:hypothetical protein
LFPNQGLPQEKASKEKNEGRSLEASGPKSGRKRQEERSIAGRTLVDTALQ